MKSTANNGRHQNYLILTQHSVPSRNSSSFSIIGVGTPVLGTSDTRISEAPVYSGSEWDIADLPALLNMSKHYLQLHGAIRVVPPSTWQRTPLLTSPASYVDPSDLRLPHPLFAKDFHELVNQMPKVKGSVVRKICENFVPRPTCHGVEDADGKINSRLICGKRSTVMIHSFRTRDMSRNRFIRRQISLPIE